MIFHQVFYLFFLETIFSQYHALKYCFNIELLPRHFKVLSAPSFICLTLSLVKSRFSPISSSVIVCLPNKPKYIQTTDFCLGVSFDRTFSKSDFMDSLFKLKSGLILSMFGM